jgi:hypothetical protein
MARLIAELIAELRKEIAQSRHCTLGNQTPIPMRTAKQ